MKKYLISAILVLIGIACFISYNIIGSEIAADGTLIEPFFLIPMGCLAIFLSIASSLMLSIWAMMHKPQKYDKIVFFSTSGFAILIVGYLSVSFAYLSQIG